MGLYRSPTAGESRAAVVCGANGDAMSDTDRPLIWIDGAIVPRSEARVSVYDHCLLYGDGVFEGIRFYNGRVFKMETHLDRLFASAASIRLTVPYTKDELVQVMRDTIAANDLTDGYIRLVVTRGVGTLGLNPLACPKAGVFCIADSITLYPEEMYTQGMKIIVARRPRLPVRCLDPSIKSCNYLNNILAKMEAIDAGLLEAIMLNENDEVAECTGDNIFMVSKGKVFTPPVSAGILNGVTRRFVMGLCENLDIECEEKTLFVPDLAIADEVFLTGTAAEVIAVSAIDDSKIGTGGEGAVTGRLREAFYKAVRENAPED